MIVSLSTIWSDIAAGREGRAYFGDIFEYQYKQRIMN